MATIQKRTNGTGATRYRVMVRLKGRPSISATFNRRADAVEWANQAEQEVRRGLYIRRIEAEKHLVAEVIDRYKRDLLPHKGASREAYGIHLDWWRRQLGSYRLSDITPQLIAEYRDRLKLVETLQGGERSPATVNRYMATLSHCLSVAVKEWGWIETNPCRNVSRLREARGRLRYLTEEERTRLLAECKVSKSAALYVIVLLALSTGARRGELLGLRWTDINLVDGTLTFRFTKNGEDRTVPVEGLALEVLREWAKVQPLDRTAFVFPAEDGERPASLREAFMHALQRAKINDFRWHDMRHDAASRLVMAGCTLRDVQEMLGHKTASMTVRYSHLSPEHMRTVAAKAAL